MSTRDGQHEQQVPEDYDSLSRKTGTIVFVGKKGSGKSCLAGTLYFHFTGEDERWIKRKLERLTAEYTRHASGHPVGGVMAYFMDKTYTERETLSTNRGNYEALHIDGRLWNIIDTPGNPKYEKRVVHALGLADVMVLVVGSDEVEDKETWGRSGVMVQRIATAFMLGVRQVIVCINKLDQESQNLREKAYEAAATMVALVLKRVGFHGKRHFVQFLPISCALVLEGHNVVSEDPEVFPWWKGPCLAELLARAQTEKCNPDCTGFMLIREWFKIGGIGTVCSAVVLQGTIRENRRMDVGDGTIKLMCRSLERWFEGLQECGPGDMIALNVRRTSSYEANRCIRHVHAVDGGDFQMPNHWAALTKVPKMATWHSGKEDVPDLVDMFVADIRLVRTRLHKRGKPFDVGSSMDLSYMIGCTQAKVVSIIARLDHDFRVVERYPEQLHKRDVLRVLLKTTKPIFVQKMNLIPRLDKIVLKDTFGVVGGGVVRKAAARRTLNIGVREGTDEARVEGVQRLLAEEFDVQLHTFSTCTRSVLSGLNLLYTSNVEGYEMECVEEFVRRGGSVLYHVRASSLSHSLLAAYGMVVEPARADGIHMGHVRFRNDGLAKPDDDTQDTVSFDSIMMTIDRGRWQEDDGQMVGSSDAEQVELTLEQRRRWNREERRKRRRERRQEKLRWKLEVAEMLDLEQDGLKEEDWKDLSSAEARRMRREGKQRWKADIARLEEQAQHRMQTDLTREEMESWDHKEVVRFVAGHRALRLYLKEIAQSPMTGKDLVRFDHADWESMLAGVFAGEECGRNAVSAVQEVLEAIERREATQNENSVVEELQVGVEGVRVAQLGGPGLQRTLSAQEVMVEEAMDDEEDDGLGDALESLHSEASEAVVVELDHRLGRTESWAGESRSDRDQIDIEDLPEEVWLRIFTYLDDPQSVCAVAQTCGWFNDLADRDVVWESLCEQAGVLWMSQTRHVRVNEELAHNLLERSEFKLRFYAYWTLVRDGPLGCLARGVYGKGRFLDMQGVRDGHSSLTLTEDVPGVDVVASRRRRRGGGALMVYAKPGHMDNRKGQMLVLLDVSPTNRQGSGCLTHRMLARKGNNARVWLKNYAHVASFMRPKMMASGDGGVEGQSSSSSSST